MTSSAFIIDLDDHNHAHCPDDDLICSEDAKCVFIDNKFACECEQGFVGNGTHCYGELELPYDCHRTILELSHRMILELSHRMILELSHRMILELS